MEPPSFYREENIDYVKEHFRLPKCLMKQWKEKICWMYSFPWRPEQLEILTKFQNDDWEKFIIQAIFGGGKTTMIIAMIHDLVLQEKVSSFQEIMVCAFNVAIKNEIKKKLKYLGKVVPRTFDSIVWQICKELEYPNLKKPNFLEKRKFLYQNLNAIAPDETIKYIFLDEAQDLEKNVEYIFFKRFPNARFIIVGDIFQSIQKEPRESFLWTLLQQKLPNSYNMTNTPRVPIPILDEVKSSLFNYYPEFQNVISNWTSSNTDETLDKGIEWSMFQSYGDVFHKMENFVNHHGFEQSMILVFSSAITVRGTLGDVSRVRRHFVQKDYPVNSSHKLMKDDSLFISTVNSSKGLERDHVFVFLTFPLELAFSSFSNDILMNLLTVGISRCKKTIHFCIPSYKDRYSPILGHYHNCPIPSLVKKNEKSKNEKKSFLNENNYRLMPYMLEKEHSITEILQLQMISYSTKEMMQSYCKKYNETLLTSNSLSIKTEEESTLLGLVFEALILSSWKNTWVEELKSVSTTGHDVFNTYSLSIKKLFHEWNLFGRMNPFFSSSDEKKVEGAIMYGKLFLGFHQKVFVKVTPELRTNVLIRWRQIKHLVLQLRPKHVSKINTQHQIRYSYMNGIVDVMYQPEDDLMEIFEIKASKQREWMENALLQALFYGICKKRSILRIHLINVYSGKWMHYYVNFKKDLDLVLRQVINDLQLYNLNCYLSKNRTIHNSVKKNFYMDNVHFLDGKYNVETNEWKQIDLYEMSSPTKISLLFSNTGPQHCYEFLEKTLPQTIQDLNIKKIIVGRKLWRTIIPSLNTDVRFLNKLNQPLTDQQWEQYLIHTNWYKEKMEIKEDETRTNIDWNNVISSASIQICDLCNQFNFVN